MPFVVYENEDLNQKRRAFNRYCCILHCTRTLYMCTVYSVHVHLHIVYIFVQHNTNTLHLNTCTRTVIRI